MKHSKALIALTALLAAVLIVPFVVLAEGTIFDSVRGDRTVDEWFTSDVVPNAGKGAEWYIFALKMADIEIDGEAYLARLDDYLNNNTLGAVAYQRCALASLALGKEDDNTVDSTIGKGGIMSYVFALHLLNNGALSAEHTAGSVVQKLTEMQNEDGGWSLGGKSSDVDVTAMTLQALAIHKADISENIDKALDFLAASRCDDGGFASYGTENCESASMVMLALAALEIDDDMRFDNIDEVIERYAVDGGYSHTVGDAKSSIATVQALCAKAARICRQNDSKPFIFESKASDDESKNDESSVTSSETSRVIESSEVPEVSDVSGISDNTDISEIPESQDKMTFKQVLCIVIAGISLLAITVLLIKKRYKNALAVLAAAIVLFAAVLILNIETPDEHFKTESRQYQYSATFAIYCDAITIEPVPYDGVVIGECIIGFDEGESVCDILKRAAKQSGITIDGTEYVRSIGTLSEMQYGPLSGWVYSVGGKYPAVPCTEYFPADGDVIIWRYTVGEIFD